MHLPTWLHNPLTKQLEPNPAAPPPAVGEDGDTTTTAAPPEQLVKQHNLLTEIEAEAERFLGPQRSATLKALVAKLRAEL